MKKSNARLHRIKPSKIFNPKHLSNQQMNKRRFGKFCSSKINKYKKISTDKQGNKIKKFEIKKENENLTKFDPTVNYFNEYWNMYYENEYILAKIKETVYEINVMQAHVEELNNLSQIS